MGDRSGRTTRPFDSANLVKLTKQPIVAEKVVEEEDDDDPFVEWDDSQVAAGVVAVGSQSNALPTTSRTATVYDPMTTGLLAEVARRTSTQEIDPSTLAAAVGRSTVDIDPETLAEALRDAQRTPVPEVHANTRRRTK